MKKHEKMKIVSNYKHDLKWLPSSSPITYQRPTNPKRPIQEGTPTMAHPFSEEEYKEGIAAPKNNKEAVGRDDIVIEQLKHLRQKANRWLPTMLNVCFT